MVKELANIQTRTTATVHIAMRIDGGRWTPICGSGQVTTGTRKQSQYNTTTGRVTCKKCRAQLTADYMNDVGYPEITPIPEKPAPARAYPPPPVPIREATRNDLIERIKGAALYGSAANLTIAEMRMQFNSIIDLVNALQPDHK